MSERTILCLMLSAGLIVVLAAVALGMLLGAAVILR